MEKVIQTKKNFNPHITVSLFILSEHKLSSERFSYDSLEYFDKQTISDPNLIDTLRTLSDAELSAPLSFENSQQIPREPKKIKKNPRIDEIKTPTSPLDATSSHNPNLSQPRLTSRLRRQPVKDYRTDIPLSKVNFDPKF